MSEPSPAEIEAFAWAQGLAFGAPSALVRVDFEFGGKPVSFKRCHDRTFAETDVSPLETMPTPAAPGPPCPPEFMDPLRPDITPEEAAALMIESAPGLQDGTVLQEFTRRFTTRRGRFAGIEASPIERWKVGGCFLDMTEPIKGRAPKLRQAVEKFRAAVAWRNRKQGEDGQ